MKLFLMAFFLQFFSIKLSSQESSVFVVEGFYKVWADMKDSLWYPEKTFEGLDFEIYDDKDSLIFEWPNIIGRVDIKKVDSNIYIRCNGRLMSIEDNKVSYPKVSYVNLKLNYLNGMFEKNINLDSLSHYRNLFYSQKKQSSRLRGNANYKRLYAQELMLDVLCGNYDSFEKLTKLKDNSRIFDHGLDAIDYRCNLNIIKQLTGICSIPR